MLPEHLLPKLSTRENDYFMEYSNLLSDYCASVEVDLTSDLEVQLFFLCTVFMTVCSHREIFALKFAFSLTAGK